jgi:type VI protein secretion system component VasF
MIRRLSIALTALLLTAANAFAQAPTTPQEGFVQANELPPGQQLPAGAFLVGSYAFFLVLMVFYLWTIWRRIDGVEKDMRDLERRQSTAKH